MAVPVSEAAGLGAGGAGACASRTVFCAHAVSSASSNGKSSVRLEPNLRLALCSFIVLPVVIGAVFAGGDSLAARPVLLVPTPALVASLATTHLRRRRSGVSRSLRCSLARRPARLSRVLRGLHGSATRRRVRRSSLSRCACLCRCCGRRRSRRSDACPRWGWCRHERCLRPRCDLEEQLLGFVPQRKFH